MDAKTATHGPGRPRSYDRDVVLAAVLETFRRRGYEATSLDDLLSASGLSKSSFYGCFGSKHGALEAAVADYSARSLASLKAAADAERDDEAAVAAMFRRLAEPGGDGHGCFIANCVTELAPHDAEVAALSRRHIEKIEALLAERLQPSRGPLSAMTARALIAVAFGAILLRKAGFDPLRIEEALQLAESLRTT
jgi:TetR/AcrR family transcriptional repressor of nem operon